MESDPCQEVAFGWLYKSRHGQVCLDILVFFLCCCFVFVCGFHYGTDCVSPLSLTVDLNSHYDIICQ